MKKKYFSIILAALSYGFLNYVSGKFYLPGSSFVELRPQVALPMFIGFIYGPWAGFFVGLAGDRIGYAFQDHNILHAWNWGVGNGFIGMIPGAMHFQGVRRIRSIRDFQNAIILIILASFVPILFASILDVLIERLGFIRMLYTLVLPAFITDAVFGVLIVPLMLAGVGRLQFTVETRNVTMISYLVVMSVLITYFVSAGPMWDESTTRGWSLHDLYNIGILSLGVLISGIGISIFLVRRVTAPLMSLSRAAERVARGDYEENSDLKSLAGRPDEIGALAAVFMDMMNKIRLRQERLETRLRDLRIEIDHKRRDRDIEKITGTDYFKNLKNRAREIRSEHDRKKKKHN